MDNTLETILEQVYLISDLIPKNIVGAKKIDGTILDTYGIVVVAFLMTNKANWIRFFEETFLIANIRPEVVFRILFFILSDADIDFLDWELR